MSALDIVSLRQATFTYMRWQPQYSSWQS